MYSYRYSYCFFCTASYRTRVLYGTAADGFVRRVMRYPWSSGSDHDSPALSTYCDSCDLPAILRSSHCCCTSGCTLSPSTLHKFSRKEAAGSRRPLANKMTTTRAERFSLFQRVGLNMRMSGGRKKSGREVSTTPTSRKGGCDIGDDSNVTSDKMFSRSGKCYNVSASDKVADDNDGWHAARFETTAMKMVNFLGSIVCMENAPTEDEFSEVATVLVTTMIVAPFSLLMPYASTPHSPSSCHMRRRPSIRQPKSFWQRLHLTPLRVVVLTDEGQGDGHATNDELVRGMRNENL